MGCWFHSPLQIRPHRLQLYHSMGIRKAMCGCLSLDHVQLQGRIYMSIVCSRSRRAAEFGFTLDRQAILGSSSNLHVVNEAVRGIRWRIMHVQPQDHPGGQKFECILLLPCSKSQSVPPSGFPLIVMVHGGPHASYPTLFNQYAAFFCATQRKAILMVNYRLGI